MFGFKTVNGDGEGKDVYCRVEYDPVGFSRRGMVIILLIVAGECFVPTVIFVREPSLEAIAMIGFGASMLVLAIYTWWKEPLVVVLDGRSVTLKENRKVLQRIELGPDVAVEITRDLGKVADGYGGLNGLYFYQGDVEVGCTTRQGFNLDDVRRMWPPFIQVVERHGMRVGPHLAALLEHKRTGTGPLPGARRSLGTFRDPEERRHP